MTLEEVSQKLNIKTSTLSTYESTYGERGFNFIIVDKLAKLYNVSCADIIYACNNIKSVKDNLNQLNYEDIKTLSELRECAGLNLMQACEKLEINRSTLFRYEKGETKLNSIIIYKMHLAYNVSCDDIINACFKTFKIKKYKE